MCARLVIIGAVWAFLTVPYASPAVAASHDAAAQRQSEEQAAETKIEELDRNMQELDEESRKREGQPRAELNRLYEEFKEQQKAARRGLENLRKSSNETWDKTRAELNKAIENLNGLYERTRDRIRGKDKDETKQHGPL